MLNSAAIVKEFQDKFETSSDEELWKKLIEEEAKELVEAFENVMKEQADLMYVISGLINIAKGPLPGPEDFSPTMHKASAISAMLCFLVSDKHRHEVFNRVHASNMSKLGDDGKPVRREDGKVMKGPNYKKPDLSDIDFLKDEPNPRPNVEYIGIA